MTGPFDLTGRRALVTGAGSPTGIGFVTACMLGTLGAQVALTSTTGRIHDRVGELDRRGIRAVGYVADLTEESAVASLPDDVDILVNNAGMISIGSPGEAGAATGTSLAAWRAGIARNLDTAFLVSRRAAPGMAARGWGRIVNVASVTGPVAAMRDEAVYATAKAGLVGLTRSMAVDLAARGVTVNAVAPGWIATGSQTPDEREEGFATPMGRSGTADEVASAICWLCSPGASYTTGQCLVVDGGNTIAEQRR
jgi:3-oxoacyl-[acyl-carrier protein] reductase